MQSANLLAQRYEQLVQVFTKFYMPHPDAEIYSAEHRVVLAKCMATKVAYGVLYNDDIEHTLKRLNEWKAS
jgi:hypothetical protein